MDTKRRTKIVATMGQATDDPQVVAGMVGAGLDVARINFSHGTRESQCRRVEMVRQAAREAGRYIGLLADLAGPKIRIESFHHGKVQLVEGAPFALDTALDPAAGNELGFGKLLHLQRCSFGDMNMEQAARPAHRVSPVSWC